MEKKLLNIWKKLTKSSILKTNQVLEKFNTSFWKTMTTKGENVYCKLWNNATGPCLCDPIKSFLENNLVI